MPAIKSIRKLWKSKSYNSARNTSMNNNNNSSECSHAMNSYENTENEGPRICNLTQKEAFEQINNFIAPLTR